MGTTIDATGIVWLWTPKPPARGSWYFLTIDPETATEIRYEAMGRSRGFGSVKVVAAIGGTRWQTSLFPHRESGGFLLPLKAEVRRAEKLCEGHAVCVRLEV